MKLFTRSILIAVAVSMLAVPMAQAQQRHDSSRHYSQSKRYEHRANERYDTHRHLKKRHHWAKGKRVPDWQRRQAIRDYHRYGLKRPGRGQQWVKVDNDYLLISLASGIISGIVAAR
jgi:Ni/Co efflux regulator RcnB